MSNASSFNDTPSVVWSAYPGLTLLDTVPEDMLALIHPHWRTFAPVHPTWHYLFGFLYVYLGIVSISGKLSIQLKQSRLNRQTDHDCLLNVQETLWWFICSVNAKSWSRRLAYLWWTWPFPILAWWSRSSPCSRSTRSAEAFGCLVRSFVRSMRAPVPCLACPASALWS